MFEPRVRPGLVEAGEKASRLFVYFSNSAQGNAAIQLLTALGVADDGIGVVPPEEIGGEQGMILAVVPGPVPLRSIEQACRSFGGRVHRA